jgi:hypothetical protein
MIRTGVVRQRAGHRLGDHLAVHGLVDRNVAVLFGDGAAAVVLQATDREKAC